MAIRRGRPPKKGAGDRPTAPEVIIRKLREAKEMFHPKFDRGTALPCWTRRGHIAEMEENVRRMKRAIDKGYISPEMAGRHQQELETKEARLAEIKAFGDEVKSEINRGVNRDKYVQRYRELGERISEAMPPRKLVRERRVNPHTILKTEKGLNTDGSKKRGKSLEELKREYQILGHALGEETNVGFLQRD